MQSSTFGGDGFGSSCSTPAAFAAGGALVTMGASPAFGRGFLPTTLVVGGAYAAPTDSPALGDGAAPSDDGGFAATVFALVFLMVVKQLPHPRRLAG